METLGTGALWRCTLRDGIPVELLGEESRLSLSRSDRLFVRSPGDDDYMEARTLDCTTHRIHFTVDDDVLGVRFDSVVKFETRGGLVKSKKLVLMFASGDEMHEISIRVLDKSRFDSLLSVLTSTLQEKAWLKSGGFVPKPILGGISRVIARIEKKSNQQGALLDEGLSDLNALKANAKELRDMINSMVSMADGSEVSEINSLLKEYGLFENHKDNVNSGNQASGPSRSSISNIVDSAVQGAGGVILLHDLFCLVNRKLKLERIYSPRHFLDELTRIPSINMFSVNGYRVVVSLRLEDLDLRLQTLLNQNCGKTEVDICAELGINNQVVLHLLLLKVEEIFGRIIRDQTQDGTDWYLNVF